MKTQALIRFLFALALCAVARGESFVIATYNVENYGPANRMTEDGYRENYPKPEAQKVALRRVIADLKADILILQEMGPAAYLEELRRDLRSEGAEYPHGFIAVAADPDRHVAVLSRRPIVRTVTHAALDFPYFGGTERVKRGMLEIAIATSAGEVTLFGVHLKSRFTDRADDPMSNVRRIGEATAVRDAILRTFPAPNAARFILLGDCNDSPASKPLDRLRRRGTTAITTLLPVRDSRDETWTHYYRKEDAYSRVDHILVSPALLPWVEGATARIYDGPDVRKASDHRPVWVRLNVPAGK